MSISETSGQTLPARLTISVIIPVRDGGPNFRRCLQGITKASPTSTEIIVVADGDTDGSWRVAEEFGARVVKISKPQGPARARNVGAQAAQGDILFFLDADVAIHPDALHQVQSAFGAEPHLAALFGSYDDEPGENNFLSQYKNLFHHYVHQISREEASTFWSGCGAIGRKIFLELGGFNESYRKPCIEDIELGYRLKQGGYPIRLTKDLQVKHLKRWNMLSLLKSDFFDRALPWTELILRDRRFINDLNLRISSRLSVILVYLLLLALTGGSVWNGSFAFAGGFALLLFLANIPLFRFFARKRGFWFMIRTIPWNWLYYFYSGLAFAIGFSRFFFSGYRSSHIALAPIPPKIPETVRLTESR